MKTITYNPETHKLVPIDPTDEMLKALTITASLEASWASAYKAMLNAAPAAEEAPQQEPNWKHPKIQSLIGADARNRIVIDLIWQILEQPEREDFTAADMEYWDSIHDAVKAAITKQQPATHVGPVAWMWKDGTITSDPDRADGTWMPLYTSPQPTPELMQAARQALEALEAIYLSLSPESVLAKSIKSRIDALQNALKGTT